MSKEIVVCALYKFVHLEDFRRLRESLLELLNEQKIKGTLLVAREGINGTVAGSRNAIDALLHFFEIDERLKNIGKKESYTDFMPFYRAKVKIKKEIVTLGVEGIDPNAEVGTYVKPKDWNTLLSRDDVVVVDTRNEYEYKIGTFRNALNPKTTTFREFPKYVENNLNDVKDKKVAMFCTGGIRCEKSTSLLKKMGFKDVYHLEGGILQYLEDVPQEDSFWEGECFVFDNRVSVDHDLQPGKYTLCHACRMPLRKEEIEDESYIEGIRCRYCDNLSPQERHRFEERQKQIELAKERHETHMGDSVLEIADKRRLEKKKYKDEQRKLSPQQPKKRS